MSHLQQYFFYGRRVIVARSGEDIVLPTSEMLRGVGVVATEAHLSPVHGLSVNEVAEAAFPEEVELRSVRSLFGSLPEERVLQIGSALQLLEWRRDRRICGVCGTETRLTDGGTTVECPECLRRYFPRVSPAVIVRVDRGDKILLGRAPGRPGGWFSTLAGFVEPGESLEETVVREVREEVGIDVGEVRYFGSQAWPFPDSLMVGFTARYRSGDLQPQPGEIEEAAWFGVEELPPVPPAYSIARQLIDDFVRTRGGDPSALATWKV